MIKYLVKRAKIILLALSGETDTEIARMMDDTCKQIYNWRKRWRESKDAYAIERIKDLPRSGKPAKHSPEQICSIIAIACEKPQESGRAITHWTQQEIANEAMKRAVAPYVSQRAVGHFFKKCRPQTTPDSRLVKGKA